MFEELLLIILFKLLIEFNILTPWPFNELYKWVIPSTFKEFKLCKFVIPLTSNLDNIVILSAIISFASMSCKPVEDNYNNPFNI